MGMIGELLATIGQFVPPWLLASVVGVLLVLMAPGWVEGVRIKRVKSCLRRMVRADDTLREALAAEAFALAAGRGEVLVALVREADKMNRPALRERALRELTALGTHGDVVRQLQLPADRTQDRRFGHPLEAAVAIERLIESGAIEAARARLREARARFPSDRGLRDLEQVLSAAPVAEPSGTPGAR